MNGRPGRAHFRVSAQLDKGRAQAGTVTIDRGSALFSVRPLRSRRAYTLPLGVVASIVVAKLLKAELAEKRARGRGRGRP